MNSNTPSTLTSSTFTTKSSTILPDNNVTYNTNIDIPSISSTQPRLQSSKTQMPTNFLANGKLSQMAAASGQSSATPQSNQYTTANTRPSVPIVTQQQSYTPTEIQYLQEKQTIDNPELQKAINIQNQFQTLMGGPSNGLNEEMMMSTATQSNDNDISNQSTTAATSKTKSTSSSTGGIKKYIYPTTIFILLFASIVLVLVSQMSFGSKMFIALALIVVFIMYYVQIKSFIKPTSSTNDGGVATNSIGAASTANLSNPSTDNSNVNVKRTAPGGGSTSKMLGKLFNFKKNN